MTKLLAISRVLPISSVECKSGFSKQNLIKTQLRCSLTTENLEHLMHISINGPMTNEYDPLPTVVEIVEWHATSSRTQQSRASLLNRNKSCA